MVCQRLSLAKLHRVQAGPLPALFPFYLLSTSIFQLVLLLWFFIPHEVCHASLKLLHLAQQQTDGLLELVSSIFLSLKPWELFV